ncbi:hypothetical protein RA2_00152 [Roseovarius sp. A-2]|uniref:hypothetical protein n=1 Tax=Roseovarius sp. A-2 TaxID=1570360 RepID=UPI0009CFE1B3|nr:hypothetical protein [Roseovarius sp. A-2]GAW33116.1 hypothetical protein RA2_00152 [Roseovarius sp. A-2]
MDMPTMAKFLVQGRDAVTLFNQISCTQVDVAQGAADVGAVGIGFAETTAPLIAEVVASDNWQIDIAGQRVPAAASLKPFFDPSMARVES